ncbi:hypothetical protein DIPPA_18422 [Diplonema papillatum]|nr:hypothetical protein DIPPA_18422 [Diplonema papillatum]
MYATSGKSRACASSQLHNGRVPPYMPQIDADVEAQDVGSMHALLVTLLNQQQLMQLQLNQFVMMQEQSNKKTTEQLSVIAKHVTMLQAELAAQPVSNSRVMGGGVPEREPLARGPPEHAYLGKPKKKTAMATVAGSQYVQDVPSRRLEYSEDTIVSGFGQSDDPYAASTTGRGAVRDGRKSGEKRAAAADADDPVADGELQPSQAHGHRSFAPVNGTTVRHAVAEYAGPADEMMQSSAARASPSSKDTGASPYRSSKSPRAASVVKAVSREQYSDEESSEEATAEEEPAAYQDSSGMYNATTGAANQLVSTTAMSPSQARVSVASRFGSSPGHPVGHQTSNPMPSSSASPSQSPSNYRATASPARSPQPAAHSFYASSSPTLHTSKFYDVSDIQGESDYSPDTREFLDKMKLLDPI